MIALLTLALAPEALALEPVSGCQEAVDSAAIGKLIEDIEYAYLQLDEEGLRVAGDGMITALACLNEPLGWTDAAGVHRALGIHHFVFGDVEGAELSFAAARSIEPNYRFSSNLVPEGNPLRQTYMAMPLERRRVEAAPPAEGRLTFDGREGLERTTSWPTILQVFDVDGSVRATRYLTPGEPLPDYPLRPVANIDGDDLNKGRFTLRWPPRPGLAIGAGAAAVIAGGAWAWAAHTEDVYLDPTTPYADLDALRARANGLTVVSWGLGAGAVGMGAGAILVARW